MSVYTLGRMVLRAEVSDHPLMRTMIVLALMLSAAACSQLNPFDKGESCGGAAPAAVAPDAGGGASEDDAGGATPRSDDGGSTTAEDAGTTPAHVADVAEEPCTLESAASVGSPVRFAEHAYPGKTKVELLSVHAIMHYTKGFV